MSTKTCAGCESCDCPEEKPAGRILWLQIATLLWMLVECSVALYAARKAHSALLLAFGSDSFVEFLSALVVLGAALPAFRLKEETAARWTGVLLFVLAGVVAVIAMISLAGKVEAESSPLGMAITLCALLVMPLLAWLKRKTARQTGNRALAADAVQSATCAWLASATLIGLAVNARFHLPWLDSVMALAVLPILIKEGRRALRGESCGCSV